MESGTAQTYILMVAAAVLLAASSIPSCRAGTALEPAAKPQMGFIEVSGFGFRDQATGESWVPVGANYDHDAEGKLIEDYWNDEWDRVVGDFEEMAQLGFTVVRIHLQLGRFMTGPTAMNEHQLARLDRLVDLSERLGLRLDITGLAQYRKTDIPAWFLDLADEQMVETEAFFWSAIAARYAGEPAVFCYDLQNEPTISLSDTDEIVGPPFEGVEGAYHFINNKGRNVSGPWGRWVRERYRSAEALEAAWPDFPKEGESFDDIRLPGYLDRRRAEDLVDFGHERAREWTAKMVTAIREHDERHLITVGLLPDSLPFFEYYSSFAPTVLADLLDFTSIHIHLRESEDGDNLIESEMVLRAAYVGAPVVVEEFSMLVQPERAEMFLDRSRQSASGYMGYYWGDTPHQLISHGKLRDGITADHIETISTLAREMSSAPPERRPGEKYRASITDLRVTPDTRNLSKAWYAGLVDDGKFGDFELTVDDDVK